MKYQAFYTLGFFLSFTGGDPSDIDSIGTEMAAFFQEAIDWGVEAGLLYLGGLAGLVLVFRLFK